jgi:hypothetical protein
MCDELNAPTALPQGKSPRAHRIGGWVGPTVSLKAKVKKSYPCQELNPDSSAMSSTI